MSEGSREDSASPGRIGHYEILEELGRGGMGVVYRARDVRLDRIVALKRPLVDEGADPGSSYERFHREARAAAKLSHPNIVPIYEVFEEDGVPWLAMEYVEGSSLRERLSESQGPLPVEEVLRLGEDLAAAVQAAHAGHVLHRDINPNNILIGKDGRALVMDFGLARFHVPPEEASEASTLSDAGTRSGAIRGTPGYMSPEQALGRPVDRRTDVFSLGAVLYEMCTGRQAFSGSAQGDVIDAILHREVDAIARFNYAVPEELERIVRKSLAKSADERYQDARDLLVDLRTLRRKGVAPGPAPGVPRPRRRSTLSLVLGAAFVGLIVLAWLLRGKPESVMVPPARAAVAVLPFADRTGDPDGDLRAAMVADLLGARLADSEGFRALGSRRTADIARAVDPGDPPEVVLARLREAAATDWVILGSLYREQDTWVATGEVHGPGEAPGTFRAEAATSVALVSAALPQVLAILGAGSAVVSEEEAAFTASEEARLLEFEGRRAVQRSDYGRAVGLLERAVEVEPGFIAAQGALADALWQAGYVLRSQEVIARARRLVDSRQAAVTLRQSQELRAVAARIAGDFAAEATERAVLAERYPDEPETLLDWSEALERAGRNEQALPPVDTALALDPRNPRARLRRARVLTRLQRWDEVPPLLDEAAAIFASLSLDGGAGEVAMARGYLDYRRKEYDAAAADYREAAEAFRAAGLDARWAEARKAEGDMDLRRGNLGQAREKYDAAMARARATGNLRLVVNGLNSLGAAYLAAGSYEDAERTLRAAVQEGRDLGNPRFLLPALTNLASALIYTGHASEGQAFAEEALELARERGDRDREVLALSLLADVSIQRGRIREALESYDSLVALDDTPNGDRGTLSTSLASRGWLRGLSGDPGPALEDMDRSVALERELGRDTYLAYALCDRGMQRGLLGMEESSQADLDEAERLATGDETLADLVPRIALARGEVLAARGAAVPARVQLEAASETPGADEALYLVAPALAAEARVALLAGDAAGAAGLAREALDHPSARPHERTIARNVLAAALAASGRTDEAAREAGRALDEAESMGLRLEIARAAALLLQVGGRRDGEAASLRSRRDRALEAFLDAAPAESRAFLRGREDLKWLFSEASGRPGSAGGR